MHYISNVERKDPIVSSVVLDTEGAASCDLKLLFDLQFAHFFECLEGYLEFLLFSHPILEVVPALPKVPLADLEEFFLD